MKRLGRNTLATDASALELRVQALERRFMDAPGSFPIAYATVASFTALDGTDYALTGLDGFFVGPDNSEGVLAGLDPIGLLNNDDGTFTVDEALETNLPGLYEFDFHVSLEDGGGFPAGVLVALYLESGTVFGPAPNNYRELAFMPVGEQEWSMTLSGLALISSPTGNGEFVYSVQTVGGDVGVSGGWIVSRPTSIPTGL